MNTPKRMVLASSIAALVAGCASGGGHGDSASSGSSNNAGPGDVLVCIFLPWVCLFKGSVAAAPTSNGAPSLDAPAAFAKWSELPRGTKTEARSLTSGPSSGTSEVVSYPFSDGETTTLAAAGQPGIEVHATALMANPYVLGWEYQSFGIWNTNGSATSGVRASSFGAPTPASAVPTVGFAAFSGKLAGIYFSSAGEPSAAAADLSVNANFSKRALNLSSTGTTIARDARSAIAAPHLNLSGTLSYAPGSSSFAGTLANSGGTMSGASKGQFYGPTAQELGGVFTLKSPTTAETFTGAFGGKR